MADITKCKGNGCDLREGCYRYTAKDGFYYPYFIQEPIHLSKEPDRCELFEPITKDTEYRDVMRIYDGTLLIDSDAIKYYIPFERIYK